MLEDEVSNFENDLLLQMKKPVLYSQSKTCCNTSLSFEPKAKVIVQWYKVLGAIFRLLDGLPFRWIQLMEVQYIRKRMHKTHKFLKFKIFKLNLVFKMCGRTVASDEITHTHTHIHIKSLCLYCWKYYRRTYFNTGVNPCWASRIFSNFIFKSKRRKHQDQDVIIILQPNLINR